MASSSSSSHSAPSSSSRSSKYDVFLSFRGEDTRKTFVDHLYSNLEKHLISTYKDDKELPQGESIGPSLFEAIEESQIAVIVLSTNYADSSWCLEELTHIMKCRNEGKLIVMPVFYGVEPTDVRNQKRKFGEAFAKQEAKNINKAEIWKKTLVEVSNISGWEQKNIANAHESEFISILVKTILDRLFALKSRPDEDLIGMKVRFQKLESLLNFESNKVCMVGIWGVGGSGKTTLATNFKMNISKLFHGHYTVENVRETSKHGLKKLQQNMLSALFKQKVKVQSVEDGKTMMKSMLCGRKVLILLDDVDTPHQLEALAGNHNWFGSGSIIIITTRDQHLLNTHKVDHVYPMPLLSDDDAIQLFNKHAYNSEHPVEDYKSLSLRVLSYASGLPLAIKVLGSFLYDKDKNEWISTLKRLKDNPNQKVMNILKISYDGLEHEKELFLDIACFFRGWNKSIAMDILEACDYHPEIGIKVLIQKALVTIKDDGCIDMHDLVQEMGHYIVRGEHPKNPQKHSRLWKREEIIHMPFHDETEEYDKIQAIKYKTDDEHDDPYDDDEASRLCKIVSKMTKLRLLIVSQDGYHHDENSEGVNFLSNELQYINWYNYPASLFPHTFQPMKLVVLRLSSSKQKELWTGCKDAISMK